MAVFVSYSRQDEAVVRPLVLRLTKEGVKVWWDLWKNAPGDQFERRIREAIVKSTCFCVFVSQHSLASTWVAREIQAATARAAEDPELLLLPILLDGSDIPPSLSGRVRVDYRADPEAAMDQVLRAIRKVENRPPKGSVALEGTYYLHYGMEERLGPDGFLLQMDVVSFDLEETYSVLSQFEISVESETVIRDFEVEDGRALRDLFLTTIAGGFETEPAIVRLQNSASRRGRFTIDNAAGTVTADVSFRITTVGQGPRGTLLFDAGALFRQICESAGISGRRTESSPGDGAVADALHRKEPGGGLD